MPQNNSNHQTGDSNTPFFPHPRFTSRIDWYQGTLSGEGVTAESVHTLATKLCFLTFTETAWDTTPFNLGGKLYSHCSRSPNGLIVAYNPPGESILSPGEVLVIIPGKVWGSVPAETWDDLTITLADFGMVATRFDMALDDSESYLTKEALDAACKAGFARGFKKGKTVESHEDPNGWTVYVGSPKSDTRPRFYNKTAESKGKVIGVRFEVQWRRKRAEAAFTKYVKSARIVKRHQLLGVNRSFIIDQIIIDLVTGAVDFREKHNKVKNYSRCKRCDFWETFLNDLNAQPELIHIPTPITTLSDKKAWIEKYVAPTLVVIEQAEGKKSSDSFMKLIKGRAKENLSPKNKALMRQCFKERFKVAS